MSGERQIKREGNLEYRRSGNSNGYNKITLHTCPICGYDLSDPDPGEVSRHIGEHSPEEFGLSPEGERGIRDREI